jgi:DNA-binding NarL/FixJ family response regulator
MKKRLILVDDQVMFVENLKIVLELYAPEIEIVGIAFDGKQAVKKAKELRPHVILMDLRMPVLDGVGATKQILKELPETRIIMLTVFDDDEYVYEALDHGASGYLLKNMRPEALVSSIYAVLDGAVLISPIAAQKLVRSRSKEEVITAHEPPRWLESFGIREKEVLLLLIEDLSNKDISDKLGISGATVRNYVSTIYDKIGAEDRFHAIRLARPYRFFLSS